MPVIGGIVEGDWVYRKTDWWGTWQVTHRPTGDTHDTGTRDQREARAFVDQLTATTLEHTPVAAPVALTYTIQPGSRARAGHQRYTATHLATTDTEPATTADTNRVEQ